jgi:beta-lactamase regulating signal transducer with metallopeptidase domain
MCWVIGMAGRQAGRRAVKESNRRESRKRLSLNAQHQLDSPLIALRDKYAVVIDGGDGG